MTVEVRRQSTAARPSATNVQKSIVSNENGRDRRASIVTPADGGLRLMTVDDGGRGGGGGVFSATR